MLLAQEFHTLVKADRIMNLQNTPSYRSPLTFLPQLPRTRIIQAADPPVAGAQDILQQRITRVDIDGIFENNENGLKWLARYHLLGNRMVCTAGAAPGAGAAPHHGGQGQGPPVLPGGAQGGGCGGDASLIRDISAKDKFMVIQ